MKAMEAVSSIACSIYKTVYHKWHPFPHFVGLEIPPKGKFETIIRNYICQPTLSL